MEAWLANGAQLGWLIDPYKRNVWIYEAGKSPRIETGNSVAGTGPVQGFVLGSQMSGASSRLKNALRVVCAFTYPVLQLALLST